MAKILWGVAVFLAGIVFLLSQETKGDPVVEAFSKVEVASVADAMEQLYGRKVYMHHEMRPLFATKFAGPAVTVLMKKEEHAGESKTSQGMLDAIDAAPPGSVYVMKLEDGADIAGIDGPMATSLRVHGFAGAVIDAAARDLAQIRQMQFPVFSIAVAPSTSVNHYRFAGVNVPVRCAGAMVNANDIISADEDGVVVIPRAKAAEVLKKAQELADAQHMTVVH
jgi:4-hydroxy-4-methyl-2-oxoglutarate aldolase